MSASVIRYRKLVTTDVASDAVNLAESGTMGHRVQIPMSVDDMNTFFVWNRPAGSDRAVGHFNVDGGSISFDEALSYALSRVYNDIDGVTNGLNFSSSILDANTDSRVRKGGNVMANDIVMCYVIYKCYGSSSAPTQGVIYNLQDAQDMLSNGALVSAIHGSLSQEETLSNSAGLDKGAVDAMFRDLLAADPSRFFDSAGKQIPGLFEVNADTDSRGSWGFVQNDKIEIAVQMKFLNPVTRRGVDSAEEDSETVVIPAGSVFKIRLQIVATDTPSGAAAKQEVAKTELAMTIAEQAAATAKAAANAAAAQRTATQAVAAAAAQTTAAQDRYTRAVDTNKKQAAAAAKALAASKAAQAALELAITTGKKETEIQAQRAAAVTAAALADNLQAIADLAATDLATAKLLADTAAAKLAAAQTQAATALATVAAANAAAAKAAVMKADQEAADAAAAKAAADAASDPLTKKITDTEKVVLDPQTLVTLDAKLNEVKAERAAVTVTTDKAYADFIESVRKYDTSRSNLEYAISVGKAEDDIQIFKAGAVSALSAKEKANLNAQATLSTLTSYYNLELSALQLTDKAKVDAAILSSSVAAAGVNEATRRVNIATTAYTYASTVTGDAVASVAEAQATLDARISGGAVFTEVQTRRKAVLDANSILAESKIKSDAAAAALADAQKALVAANAAAASAVENINVVGATAATAETFYQSTITSAKTYFAQKTADADDNEKSLKAAALLTALNSAKDMVAAADAAYAVSKRNFDVAIVAGKRLPEVTVLRQISQDAQLEQQRAGLILQKAQTEFDLYAASVKQSVSTIMAAAANFQNTQIQKAKTNSFASIYNSTSMYYAEVKAELDAAKAQDELAKSRLDNATTGGSGLPEIGLLRQLKVQSSSEYAAAVSKYQSAVLALVAANPRDIVVNLSKYAGSATSGYSDGNALSGVLFNSPQDLALGPDGNIYVLDSGNQCIRKVTPSGVVNTLAGNPGVNGQGGYADGTGTNALFYYPSAMTIASNGDIYVSDTSNHCIRKVTPSGVVTTVAGNPTQAGHADATGTNALFNYPSGLTIGSDGDIYVADLANQCIRKVTPSGVVNTVAGNPGVYGYADGIGTNALLFSPSGLTIASNGDIYVVDTGNNCIRQLTPSSGVVTTVAGNPGQAGHADGTGTTALFLNPISISFGPDGNMYVADSSNQCIRKVTPSGVVNTIAGNPGVYGYADGTGTNALFSNPYALTIASNGDIYLVDSGNNCIRKVTPAGVVTTFVGSPGVSGYSDGTGSFSAFSSNGSSVCDSNGNIYVADMYNNCIRKITPAGLVTTLAGGGPANSGYLDASGTNARFFYPYGITLGADGNLYVTDQSNFCIRKVTLSGVVTTLAGSPTIYGYADGQGATAQFNSTAGITSGPDGNLYVSDQGNQCIRKVTLSGNVTTLAGTPTIDGYADGPGNTAKFYNPAGIAVDSTGNVYVVDTVNQSIRKITPLGDVSTIAGNGDSNNYGLQDGIGSNAKFWNPIDLTLDSSGNLYVIDQANNLIRRITPDTYVTTLGYIDYTLYNTAYSIFFSNTQQLYLTTPNGIVKADITITPSLENPNVSSIIYSALSLRESETLAAQQSEYVLETQKAKVELTNTINRSNQVDNEREAIQNRLKVALEGGKTAAEILDLQNELTAKSIESSKLQFYMAALNAKHQNALLKGTPISTVYNTLAGTQTILLSASMAQQIDSASKDVSKAFVALNTAKTEQAAAQGVYDILTEEMNTAIRQGKTMAEAAETQAALNAATTDLGNKTTAASNATKAYQAALQKYNDLQTYNNYPSTFAMQGTEISTIMSAITSTTTLSISSINAAKNNTLTRNLIQTYSQMLQTSTLMQQDKALYSTTTADFNAAIDQGKTLAEIQSLRMKIQEISNNLATNTTNLTNTTKAYTSSLLIAVESQGAKAILGAVAQTQTQITEGAKANALLNTLVEAKQVAFALNAEDKAAQSELLVAESAVQILISGGATATEIPAEKYDAIIQASNKAAIIRRKLIQANTAVMNAQLNISMNPNVEAINAIATTTYIKQNDKAETNALMKQYNEAKAKQAEAYRDLDIAKDALQLATTAFDNAIASGTDLESIQNTRDLYNTAGNQLKAANLAETYATAALNMAIENSKMSQIANALIVTQRINEENVVAGAKTTTEQYKLNLLNADLTAASAAAAAAAMAAATARANLQASTADAISQEMVDLRSAATSTAAASDAAQTALDKMRRAVLDQQAVVDAATAAFQATQAAVAANNIANFLLFNGFLFQQSTDRYVLQSSLVPTTVTAGVSFPLDTINVLPVDLGTYSTTAQYSLGNLVTYPDADGAKYMCLVSLQDPRGSSFTSIANKDPSAFPTLWIQTEGPALRYRSNTDLLISSATVQGSLIGVGIASGDLQGMQTLFTNSLANGNNSLLHGLTIFGPGLPSSTVSSPETITLTAYTNSRTNLNITASKSFLAEGGDIYIKNGKTILSAAVLAYNTYVTALATAGFIPDVRIGHLTESFMDTTKLPATITAGTPFTIGTTTITPIDRGIYNASTSYTKGDIVADTFTSKYICLVGPTSTGATYSITGTAPVETPGTSIYWKVIENRSWNALTFNSSTDIPLQITGFGSLLWTSPTYPPNTVIQLDSNFLQGYTIFGSGITQRTMVTSSSYDFAGSNYSYKLNLDAATSSNLNDTFYVKSGSSPFESSTTSKLCENLALFMNNAATNALAVVNSTTDAEATTNLDTIVSPGISTLAGLYSSNTSLMSFINVASTITGQCRSSANTHRSLLALRNSGQVSSNDYNSAKATNTTRFTAIQTRVTAAATAIAAQNTTTANTNVPLITAEQANIIADPTLKVYLLAPEYSGSGAWLDKSGNGKNATKLVGTIAKSAAGNSIVLNGSTAWGFSNLNMASGNWTASVWYKPTGTPIGTSTKYVFGQQDAGNGRINIMMTYDWSWTGTFLRAGYWTPSNGGFFSSNIPLTTNSWTHILATYDGSSLKTYVNNSLLNSVPTTTASIDGGGAYIIGGYYQSSANYVVGEIGEVRVISRALNTTQIADIYMENFSTIVGPPTVPANLTGSIITESAFTVSWSGGDNASSYTYTINGVATTPTINNGLTSKSAAFTGLSPITAYTVVVTATNQLGSTSSTSATITTARDLSVKSGLNVWLDAKDQYNMTITGTNTVTVWNDKSGLNNNTTSAVGTPQLGVNGIVFDTSSSFNLPDGCFPFNDTNYTIYVIFKMGSSNSGLLNTGNVGYYIYDVAGGRLGVQGSAVTSMTSLSLVNTQLYLYTITYSSSGYNYIQYVNGTQYASGTGTGPRNQTSTPNRVGTSGYTFKGGSIGEMIVYNSTHITINRQIVEGYLAWKWGIQGSLPSTHPFKDSPLLTAPDAPTGVTGSIITESAFTVSWTPSSRATSYTYTINGVTTTPTTDNSMSSNSVAFTGLSAATAYTVVVRAVNSGGSAASTSVTITTIRDLILKTDLRLWLDGNDAYSMTRTATNTVTAWRDKSTNAALPTISGSATGLTYSGTNAVAWSGSYLTMPNGTLPNGNSSFIYFFVVRTPNQNNTRLVNIGTSNLVGSQLGLHYRGSDMNFFQPDLTTTVPPANQINIITISYNGTTRVRTIALNGATGSTDTLGSALNLPTTSQIIGANASAGEVFSGNFYDVLVYSTALSTTQRQDVEGYLAWKWGIQATLPSNHPYRNSAPA